MLDSEDSSDSVECIESTADFENVLYPNHPICREYNYQSGQVYCSHMAFENIPNNGIKYMTTVEEFEQTDVLYYAVGAECGSLHWLFTSAKVFQDQQWYKVLLTDGCVDRLLGYTAQELRDALAVQQRRKAMTQRMNNLLTKLTESRLQLLVHWDEPRRLFFVSAIKFLQN
jgi:hypothetical protein